MHSCPECWATNVCLPSPNGPDAIEAEDKDFRLLAFVLAFVLTHRNDFHTIGVMTTKQRFRNKYRLQLREKDHEPMHVHLVGGDVNAKFDLMTLALMAGTVPPGVLAEVAAWLQANQAALIEEWKSWQI